MKRENWIDVARGVGIILVVIGHCHRPDIVLKLIQSFHMPFFFILSGYLFKAKGTSNEFVKRKLQAYIKPYIKLAAINYVIWMMIKAQDIGSFAELKSLGLRYLIGIVYSRGTWYWMPNCSAIWFLTALFVASVIFYYIVKADTSKQIIMVAACGLVAYMICTLSFFKQPLIEPFGYDYEQIKLPWNIDSALWGIPFMYFGYVLKQKSVFSNLSASSPKGKVLMLELVLIIAGLFAMYFNDIDFLSMDSMVCGNVILAYAGALTLSTALIIFVILFLTDSKILAFYGRNTITVFGYNYLINYFVYLCWDKLLGEYGFIFDWLIQGVIQVILLGALAFVLDYIKNQRKGNTNDYMAKFRPMPKK